MAEWQQDPFPENQCLDVMAELSVWTSVDDCLAAARWIEQRSGPEDLPSDKLVLPYLDDDRFEAVLIRCLGWLIRSFHVPASKVRVAALVDPSIALETRVALSGARFAPTVEQGPAGVIQTFFPPLAQHRDERFLVVQDSPHVIELVQNPLRCMVDLIGRAWPAATRMRKVREESVRTSGGAPTIFHQPYTDGPLFALVEALAFDVHGLAIGPNATPQMSGINRGYRSVEVVGRPPLDPRLFQVAQQATAVMFRSLV